MSFSECLESLGVTEDGYAQCKELMEEGEVMEDSAALQNAPNKTEIKEHMRTVEDATTFGNILPEFADACKAADTQRNYKILRGCHNAMEDLVLHYK